MNLSFLNKFEIILLDFFITTINHLQLDEIIFSPVFQAKEFYLSVNIMRGKIQHRIDTEHLLQNGDI